jgi:hypothetical protein
MSRRIAALINEPEHIVAKLIDELESRNGYPSHDARHIAHTIQSVRLKIADLKLDPDDTTAEELYHALLVKFEKDSAFFEASFGPLQKTFDQRLSLAADITGAGTELPSQWALKAKIAKNILRANPPKRVMKALSYRSVESMLKRENPYGIMLAAHMLESKIWHKKLAKSLSVLDQTDFELRPVRLETLNPRKWQFGDADRYTVFDNTLGAAAIVPAEELRSAPLLTLVLLLMEEIMPDKNIKAGSQLAHVSGTVEWWADMDHLVAELAGQHISLNLKDCALNSWLKNGFGERITEYGRWNFWQELVARYQNRPAAEPLSKNYISEQISKAKLVIPEPAFEFAEELDG